VRGGPSILEFTCKQEQRLRTVILALSKEKWVPARQDFGNEWFVSPRVLGYHRRSL
jgi:hypothetical protein